MLLFENGPAPTPDTIHHRWTGRYGLVLGKWRDAWLFASSFDGVFLVNTAERTIRCFVESDSGAGGAWTDVFVRRILPRIAILFGAAAIHGAALAEDGAGVLLLGHSGAGKSTLSASLANAGWQLLSDDISLLWEGPPAEVAPGAEGVCVWPDSREALALPHDRCAPMPGYEGKVRFTPAAGEDMPVPLKALVFLQRSPDCSAAALESVAAADALVQAGEHRIRFDPSDATGVESARNFGQMSAIIRATPCYRLTYPADYAALPEVAARLSALLRGESCLPK